MNQEEIDEEEEEEAYNYEYNEMAEAWYYKTLRMDYKNEFVNKYKNQKYLEKFLYIDIHKILDKDFKKLFMLGSEIGKGKKYFEEVNKLYKKWDEQVEKTLDEYLKEYPIVKDYKKYTLDSQAIDDIFEKKLFEIMPICPQKNK